nr:elongation of very long chain fatty acids protein 7-like isoform X1 [Cherax quadricarinatus]XP_053649703.1 elongation of very long chain fatty acids protein 7-like isoform X1 [Cherax quadricarinatus]XP_053649705.1 elongation of very long chain fatty acids protein 7-like isoform X1 [Cherax quadricarinatus]XP_053649706.1 elongation of very long chain fatty acids protein 7-like isoform X1 [Cherax quadricarinatus]
MTPTHVPPPIHSTPSQVTAPQSYLDEKEKLSELKWTGLWASVITLLNCMYGQQTFAKQLAPDPRQDSWLLMKSPLPSLITSLVYIAAVTWWGPLYMVSRKPVTGLRKVMMAYNTFQVGFSAWLFYEGGMSGWFGSYSFLCQKCDFSDNPQAIRIMHCAFWYHFSKHIDFIDTIFFVLHKKYQHISLLHMTHHGLMPISTWYGVRYYPGGHNTLFGFLNCFVHVVMYSYYLLAAMGPHVRPCLWWKKYLTTLQMMQFTIIFLQAALNLFLECDVPLVVSSWIGFVAFLFFILFTNFYVKAYLKLGNKEMQIESISSPDDIEEKSKYAESTDGDILNLTNIDDGVSDILSSTETDLLPSAQEEEMMIRIRLKDSEGL